MDADLHDIKTQVEQSLPPALVAAMREAGLVLTLEAANGGGRSIVDLSDALAELEMLGDMSSYRTEDTGVDNTIFISTKIGVRHGPRIKLAIDRPDSLSPGGVTASIAIPSRAGESPQVVVGEEPSAKVLKQARQWIELNREALLDYWECRISTPQFGARMRPIRP